MLGVLDMSELDPRQFGTAERACEAEQQQGPLAQARQVLADAGRDLAQDRDADGEFGPGTLAGLSGHAGDAGQRLTHVGGAGRTRDTRRARRHGRRGGCFRLWPGGRACPRCGER